ncbi:unnamed protein product [Aphanomyces euteiches]|uniref:Protein kinase domain-containing protein n=1 Tax=Aphanomyces euteiches TaxID=100861 RepID=A0A6G0X2J9_9STRA|nr:hypothetical protein Ae201684_009212 [Aphanomyces euteiches]KAH9070343.1 hypothetical protein Ae201684P_002705 [Aphanomyces euteiches]KAH9133143.1 hypothetical protein AeRB84_020697 [Aphanomyces euteiches]
MADGADAVKETDVAQVQEDDDGVPSQVNDYKIGALLGEGAYSKVYLCQKTENMLVTKYALKILNKSFLKRKREIKMVNGRPVHSNAFNKVVKEIAIMKKLRHPNLTKLHEVIDDAEHDKMYLVLELVTGGQVMDWDADALLYNYLGEPNPAPTSVVQQCVLDTALALEYLHANQICHRDIKPENVLMTNEKTHYKLSDFGVAHMFNEEEDSSKQLKNTEGTYHYLAPESTVGQAYDPFKVDVWALGVTAYAMLFRRLPFAGLPEQISGGALSIMQCIRDDPLEFPSSDVDPECLNMLERLLDKNPDTRLTLKQLVEHPWLAAARTGVAEEAMRVSVVSVDEQDINLAFTPVNNLLLMVKIKMKFSQKLRGIRHAINERNEARNSLGDMPSPVRESTSPAASTVQLPMSDLTLDEPEGETHGDDDNQHGDVNQVPRSPPKRDRSIEDTSFQRQSSKTVDGKKKKDCCIM